MLLGEITMARKQNRYREQYDQTPHEKGLQSVPPNAEVPKNNLSTISMIEEMAFWDLVDLTDAEAVQQRIMEYFELCKAYNSKILVSGFAFALGCTRDELINWSNGKTTRLSRVLSSESAQVVQKFLSFLEISWESAFANNGFRSPVTGIFIAKNNFGYKDESTNIVKHEDAEVAPDRAKLAAKYAAALPEQPAPVEAQDVIIEPADEE